MFREDRIFRWTLIVCFMCFIFSKQSCDINFDSQPSFQTSSSRASTFSNESAEFNLPPMQGVIPVCNRMSATCIKPHYPVESTQCLETKRKQGVDNSGAWSLPEGFMYKFDESFANATLERVLSGGSVLELGAGLGCYTTYFRESKKISKIDGYEGASNVESLTKGFIKHADLSVKQDFGVLSYDWVVCMEVAEHIPKQFEHILLGNIISPAKKGVLLTWGVPGQNGIGHVNLQTNDYVIGIMKDFGFNYDKEKSEYLRSKATFRWFQMTTMVFYNTMNVD